ncbi:MAG: hypothetical protein ACLVK8_10235 [Ruminococcus sp.]
MIYTVTFNPAIDYVVHTDAMQVGMVNRSHGEKIYYGGKGINVSVILKELGIPSRALTLWLALPGSHRKRRTGDGNCQILCIWSDFPESM